MFNFLRSRRAEPTESRGPAIATEEKGSRYDVLNEEDGFAEIWQACEPYTMTSRARGHALYSAINYIVRNNIAGDIIECGVWRGGSSMIAMAALKRNGCLDRKIVMLDTFSGMTEPADCDVDLDGKSEAGKPDGVLCYASLQDVKKNVSLIDYPEAMISYVVGDIRKTAGDIHSDGIALLRLDTDFYDSTKVELETFYPLLVSKGVLIVDDYGHWSGARTAVDEYFLKLQSNGEISPLLNRIDYTGRMAVK